MSSLPFFGVLDRWTTFTRLDFGIVEVRLGYEGVYGRGLRVPREKLFDDIKAEWVPRV